MSRLGRGRVSDEVRSRVQAHIRDEERCDFTHTGYEKSTPAGVIYEMSCMRCRRVTWQFSRNDYLGDDRCPKVLL